MVCKVTVGNTANITNSPLLAGSNIVTGGGVCCLGAFDHSAAVRYCADMPVVFTVSFPFGTFGMTVGSAVFKGISTLLATSAGDIVLCGFGAGSAAYLVLLVGNLLIEYMGVVQLCFDFVQTFCTLDSVFLGSTALMVGSVRCKILLFGTFCSVALVPVAGFVLFPGSVPIVVCKVTVGNTANVTFSQFCTGSYIITGRGMFTLSAFNHNSADGSGTCFPVMGSVSLPTGFRVTQLINNAPAVDIGDLDGTGSIFKVLFAAFAGIVGFLAAVFAGGPYLFYRCNAAGVEDLPNRSYGSIGRNGDLVTGLVHNAINTPSHQRLVFRPGKSVFWEGIFHIFGQVHLVHSSSATVGIKGYLVGRSSPFHTAANVLRAILTGCLDRGIANDDGATIAPPAAANTCGLFATRCCDITTKNGDRSTISICATDACAIAGAISNEFAHITASGLGVNSQAVFTLHRNTLGGCQGAAVTQDQVHITGHGDAIADGDIAANIIPATGPGRTGTHGSTFLADLLLTVLIQVGNVESNNGGGNITAVSALAYIIIEDSIIGDTFFQYICIGEVVGNIKGNFLSVRKVGKAQLAIHIPELHIALSCIRVCDHDRMGHRVVVKIICQDINISVIGGGSIKIIIDHISKQRLPVKLDRIKFNCAANPTVEFRKLRCFCPIARSIQGFLYRNSGIYTNKNLAIPVTVR